MIQAKEILAPATAIVGNGDSEPFDVDGRSRVVYIAPNAGDTLTEADSFELRRVVAEGPVRSVKQYNKDGSAILLGATQPQFEVVIRGTYLVRKILETTESVGVYQLYGNDEGS